MVLFVVLRDGRDAGRAGWPREIKRRIREDCSPRHVPNEVMQIEEVPRTLSGKVLEVPVKRILMGAAPEQAASLDSLANPARARRDRRARAQAERPRAGLSAFPRCAHPARRREGVSSTRVE